VIADKEIISWSGSNGAGGSANAGASFVIVGLLDGVVLRLQIEKASALVAAHRGLITIVAQTHHAALRHLLR